MMTGSALAAAPKGVLLDFTATWCGPCQKMSPLVSRLKREGYPIKKVDVDQEPELARRFNVSSIPAFVLVVDGKEVARSVGATTESNLRRMLARIPAAEPAQPERSQPRNPVVFASNDRRINQAEEAPIQLAQDQKQPEKKSRGFNLPFFGKNKSEDDSVPVEEPVIRAQFGDAPNDQFAEAAPQEEIINWRASTVPNNILSCVTPCPIFPTSTLITKLSRLYILVAEDTSACYTAMLERNKLSRYQYKMTLKLIFNRNIIILNQISSDFSKHLHFTKPLFTYSVCFLTNPWYRGKHPTSNSNNDDYYGTFD